MAKNCCNPICKKLVKWLDRNRCKVCAKYHRKHEIDRISLNMRKVKQPPKERPKKQQIEYVCVMCGTLEYSKRERTNLMCKRCQINQNSKTYRTAHPDKRKQITNNYRATHRNAYLAALKCSKDKRLSTIKGRLDNRMSARMYHALRRNKAGVAWKSVVAYTLDDLIAHIQTQFTNGMTWGLLMAGEIEIDHIIPVSSFSYSSPLDEEFKKCWALDNLQPLWKTDNKIKNAKLDWKQIRV